MQYRNVIHRSKRIRCEKVLKQKSNLYDHPFERYGPKTGHDWRKTQRKNVAFFKLFDVANIVKTKIPLNWRCEMKNYILFDVIHK